MLNKATAADALPEQILKLLAVSRQAGLKIVLATGVFDVLHQEHETFLNKAKSAGDVLIVGLESDVRVRALKGDGRPVHSENERVEQLQALQIADAVFILPEVFTKPEHYRALLATIRPAVLAVSSHTPHLEHKMALMKEVGGEVRAVHEHNPAVSTTQLLAQQR